MVKGIHCRDRRWKTSKLDLHLYSVFSQDCMARFAGICESFRVFLRLCKFFKQWRKCIFHFTTVPASIKLHILSVCVFSNVIRRFYYQFKRHCSRKRIDFSIYEYKVKTVFRVFITQVSSTTINGEICDSCSAVHWHVTLHHNILHNKECTNSW